MNSNASLSLLLALASASCVADDEQATLRALDNRVRLVEWSDAFPDGPMPSDAKWTLASPAGSSAVLDTSQGLAVGFTPDLPGIYSLEVDAAFGAGHAIRTLLYLVMTDGATATIEVGDTIASPIILSATPNFSVDGEMTYLWGLQGPPGSQADLYFEHTSEVQFYARDRGTYRLFVALTDDSHSADAEVVLEL